MYILIMSIILDFIYIMYLLYALVIYSYNKHIASIIYYETSM